MVWTGAEGSHFALFVEAISAICEGGPGVCMYLAGLECEPSFSMMGCDVRLIKGTSKRVRFDLCKAQYDRNSASRRSAIARRQSAWTVDPIRTRDGRIKRLGGRI